MMSEYSIRVKMKPVLLAFLCCIVGATAAALTTPVAINDVCDKLTNYFNVLSGIVPVRIAFPGGTDQDGVFHPSGVLSLDSSSKRETNCTAILLQDVLAVQLAFSDKLTFSNQELNATLESCEVKLHYRVSTATSKQSTTLKVVLAEVISLGKVTLENGTDFTTEAEVLIRPVLFAALNKFSNDQLSFTISNRAQDSSNIETLNALQFVLKKAVLGLVYEKHGTNSSTSQ